MFLPRLIPVLLLKGKGLVKTINFKDPRYIGEPINAVKIFNDLKADELVFLDINATKELRSISYELVRDIGDEAFMPFAVGGGIKNMKQIEKMLQAGAEKIVINSEAIRNPEFIAEASKTFGSQSIVISIDVKKSIFNKYSVWIDSGTKNTNKNPVELAKAYCDLGAGELLVNSINNDGMMNGYDIKLIKNISSLIEIPVIACGGAGNLSHMKDCFLEGQAHSLAAGSMFIYHGPRKAVLLNYPNKEELKGVFINEF